MADINPIKAFINSGKQQPHTQASTSRGILLGFGNETQHKGSHSRDAQLNEPSRNTRSTSSAVPRRASSNSAASSFTMSSGTPQPHPSEQRPLTGQVIALPMPTINEIAAMFTTDTAQGQLVKYDPLQATAISRLSQEGAMPQLVSDAAAHPSSLQYTGKPTSSKARVQQPAKHAIPANFDMED